MHIFISYAKKDTFEFAQKLQSALTVLPDVTAWMDASLESGESWALQIQNEIDRCDQMVVLLSPDVNRPVEPTQRRSFVLNEIDYAQQMQKPILPVLVGKTKLPVQLAGLQYIDATSDRQHAIESIVYKIARLSQPTSDTNSSPVRVAQQTAAPTTPQTYRSRQLTALLAFGIVLILSGLVIFLGNPARNIALQETGTHVAANSTAASLTETAKKQAEIATIEATKPLTPTELPPTATETATLTKAPSNTFTATTKNTPNTTPQGIVSTTDEFAVLNVREYGDANSQTLITLFKGSKVDILGVNRGSETTWLWVRWHSETKGTIYGWVNSKFIQLEDITLEDLAPIDSSQAGYIATSTAPTVAITASSSLPTNVVIATVQLDPGANLQMRRSPSSSAESVGLLPSGTQVFALGRAQDNQWLKVTYSGIDGWIKADYVKLTKNGVGVNISTLPIAN